MATIYGTNNNDTLFTFTQNDTVLAGGGDDWLVVNPGNHIIDGGLGVDTLSFAAMNTGVVIHLAKTDWQDTRAGVMKVTNVENIIGSNFSDFLSGNAGANRIAGWGGDDYLQGLSGNDVLRGGLGNDTFDGGYGRDAASFASTETQGVRVNLSITGFQNTNEGLDKFISIQDLYGSQMNDYFVGNSLGNELSGGEGNDTLDGAKGYDKLWGGAGEDSFVWNLYQLGVDTIGDFEQGRDKIDLNGGGITNTPYSFADLTITHANSGTQILFHNDTSAQIKLSTWVALQASDFIF